MARIKREAGARAATMVAEWAAWKAELDEWAALTQADAEWRAGLKANALEDLRKARWYLDREIERREKQA